MNQPLISVILPVYNVEAYLEACVTSLTAQTYGNLELVLVDDGSGPVCAALCDTIRETDSRITVYHKPNGGLSDARNFGIARARGEYITCVDPDDYVEPDCVGYLYALVEKYGTAMSLCQHRVHLPNGAVRDLGSEGDEKLSAKACVERMLYHDVIDTSAWAKLYHRSLFDGVEYPVGRLFEDIGTTYRLMAASGEIAVGYESKYHYIMRGGSIVNSAFNPKKLDLLDMTDQMAAEVSALWPDLAGAALRRQVYARFSTLNQLPPSGEEKTRDELIAFIRAHQAAVLRDPKTPRRDRLAIRALSLGYGAYRAMWSAYKRAAKGEA